MDEIQGLAYLVAELANAKHFEDEAKVARILCEDAIVHATRFKKAEGGETYEEKASTGTCRVVIKQPINTTIDDAAWIALRPKLDPKHPARKVFKASYSLDKKAARELQDGDPRAWAEVSSVITRKPGKIAVEVKELVMTPTTKEGA